MTLDSKLVRHTAGQGRGPIVCMEPRLTTDADGDAILQSGAESEWLRADLVIDLIEWV